MIIIDENMNLHAFNTMRMNVMCNKWIEFTMAEDAPSVMTMVAEDKYAIVGGGSNIFFTGDFGGVILHPAIKIWDAVALGDGLVEITLGAGNALDLTIDNLCKAGLWGVENLSGIPGTVGGAAVQNAGAYGAEFGDVVKEVRVWDIKESRFVDLPRQSLDYGYRHSIFKSPENRSRYIILTVTIVVGKAMSPRLGYGPLKELKEVDTLTPMDVREKVLEIRDSKLPDVDKIGSAGSFFKNPVVEADAWRSFLARAEKLGFEEQDIPHFVLDAGTVKIPAAWLIEKCGWKGKSLGEAGVWQNQPLIIVNTKGKATPEDIIAVRDTVIADVKNKFDIRLVPEVVCL